MQTLLHDTDNKQKGRIVYLSKTSYIEKMNNNYYLIVLLTVFCI